MTKKFIILLFLLISSCGFSPIYTKNQKPITFAKVEITGEKDVVFDLEKKLNLIVNENDERGYTLKAQIFQTSDNSAVDSRGVATEENLKINFAFQVFDKKNIAIYQDNIFKEKKISITDNMNNNQQIRNAEKRILLDRMVDTINITLRINLN